MKIFYFQEGDDGQEDPIELEKKNLEKEVDQVKGVIVDRAVNCTQELSTRHVDNKK